MVILGPWLHRTQRRVLPRGTVFQAGNEPRGLVVVRNKDANVMGGTPLVLPPASIIVSARCRME